MKTYLMNVRLDEDQIGQLERRLAIAASKLDPGNKRGQHDSRPSAEADASGYPDLDMLITEIVEVGRNGIRIASQVESIPIIPLMEALRQPLPVDLKVAHDQSKYVFYIAQVIFSVLLPADQYARFATLEITLKDDVNDSVRRSRPIRLFPARKDINLFTINLGGGIGVDAGINLTVPQIDNQIIPFARASVDANIKNSFVFGPIEFPFRQAEIEVLGEADQHIVWRYNLESAFYGTNEFKSFLILKVAEEARSLDMDVVLKIIPCNPRWLLFERLLPELTDRKLLPVELSIPRS